MWHWEGKSTIVLEGLCELAAAQPSSQSWDLGEDTDSLWLSLLRSTLPNPAGTMEYAQVCTGGHM